MKFSTSLTAMVALAAASTTMAQQIKPDAMASSLINALKAANLTELATYATADSKAFMPYLMAPGNKTVFMPNNDAIAKFRSTIGTRPAKEIETMLTYHIINSTVTIKSLPSSFDYNIVLPTYLNSTAFTNLPKGHTQVIVLQKPNAKEAIDIKFAGGTKDSHFATKYDGPAVGNLQIQTIDSVMLPPGNFSSVATNVTELKGLDMALTQLNLTKAVNSVKGITIFAPTSEAIAKVQQQMTSAPAKDTINVFLNHFINGTVIYSPQFPSSEDENHSSDDDDSNHSSIKTTNVTTAGGASMSFAMGKDGKVLVTCGNSTAKIIRSDVILNNGVLHYLDTVIANPTQNINAATKVAGTDQSKASISTVTNQALADSHSDSHKDSASSLFIQSSNAFIVALFAILLSSFIM